MMMVENAAKGRPPAPGPRYDCGRRRPQADPRGEQIWQRIKDGAVAVGLDRRAGTQLGRLAIRGELTDGQVVAGFHVARIYADYERWHGRHRFSPAAPYTRFIESAPEELAHQHVRSAFEEEDSER